MKKYAHLLLLVIIFLSVCITPAHAHPPSDIQLDYDPATKILSVEIYHPVSDTQKHYIAEISIAVNSKPVIRHTISIQDNTDSQKLSYKLPDVTSGDIITVEADCNISGTSSKFLEID
ncbi:MAG: hypothetical protein ABH883_00375 [Candidatus Omnitrophota bacterium]